MEQQQDSRKGKHLTREERWTLEVMSRGGIPPRDIAAALGRHRRTIERELRRGRVENRDSEWRTRMVYSAPKGQDIHDLNATAKGPELKLGTNYELASFIAERILEYKESPDVVAFRMREAGMDGAVCTKTIYSYIEQELIPGVQCQSLWEKGKRRKRNQRAVRPLDKPLREGRSIEARCPEVDTRESFGHWEMDLVVGPTDASNCALLTLVERKHRHTIIRKLSDKTQVSVLRAINGIEREYGPRLFRALFRTITADNGSEFRDAEALERSCFSNRTRTRLFYARPYASWQRGSNENANRIIRRFVAKHVDIASFTKRRIAQVQTWINDYPRRILNYNTPKQLFEQEIEIAA